MFETPQKPTSLFVNQNFRIVIFFVFYNAVLLSNTSLLSVISVDEPFYINAGSIMQKTHDYLIPRYENGDPRLNKPILIYWLVLIGQLLTGDSILGGRLIALLFTNLHLIGILLLCKAVFTNQNIGINALWIFASTPQLLERSHTILPEILVISIITWTLLIFWKIREQQHHSLNLQLFFYFFLGINFMIKGPPGVILPVVTILSFIIVRKEYHLIKKLVSLPGILLFLAISCTWYIYLFHEFGLEFFISLFEREILQRLTAVPFAFMNVFTSFYPWIWILLILTTVTIYRSRSWSQSIFIDFAWVWLIATTIFMNLFIRELHRHYTLDIIAPVILLASYYLSINQGKLYRIILSGFIILGIILSAHYHYNLIGIGIFPDENIWLFLFLSLLSILAICIVFKKVKMEAVPWIASISIVMTFSSYHLIREKGELIHQPGLYRNIDSSKPFTLMSGNTQIGTYVKMYWPLLGQNATHRLVYDYNSFRQNLDNLEIQYAFCSEQVWLKLPVETTRDWKIIATTYDTKKEIFNQTASLHYPNAIRASGRSFIKYYLIERK